MSINEIDQREITAIISSEAAKFESNLTKLAVARYVSRMALSAAGKVSAENDSSFESNNDLRSLYTGHISSIIAAGKIPERLNQAIEGSLTIGANHIEDYAIHAKKYASQESYYRANQLKKDLNVEGIDRKGAISKIDASFESLAYSLELAECMADDWKNLFQVQENEIIDGVVEEVQEVIAEAEEKSEATRVIMNEFTKASDEVKTQQDALNPEPLDKPKFGDEKFEDDAASGESINFHTSTEYIKKFIPVTASRFSIEAESGKFTRKNLTKFLVGLEDFGDYNNDLSFVKQRIDAIREDITDKREFDPSKFDNFEDLFKKATDDVDGVFSAFRQVGFGRGTEPSAKPDADTLSVLKGMISIGSKDNAKRINDIEILYASDIKPIADDKEFIKMSLESFELKTAMVSEVGDYDSFRKATELRDEYIAEFLIDGMKHVPEARQERLKDIRKGLEKMAKHNPLDQFKTENLQQVYYKTAKVAAPEIFVDFDVEAERVKDMIKNNYGTDKYSEIVDDFFKNRGQSSSHISEENLYEAFVYGAAMHYTTEGIDFSVVGERIKTYSKVNTTFVKTIESLGMVNAKGIKGIVKELKGK